MTVETYPVNVTVIKRHLIIILSIRTHNTIEEKFHFAPRILVTGTNVGLEAIVDSVMYVLLGGNKANAILFHL